MANDDLHKPLKAINQSIARLREDVQSLVGEVKKVKTAITEAAQTIRDAIHENIQAQAELKLMEHVMEVKSVKPQIEAERDQIETEREELDERLASIGERYQEKHAELDEKARERIRDLGSHIFEIDEDQFEAGIEDPFTEQVTTTWQFLQAHNEAVGEDRTTAVRETTGDAVQTIYDYMDRQEQLVETIQNHRLDTDRSIPTDREETLQVPYYVVEYEVDGVTERETVVPSRLSSETTGWTTVSLDPVPGAPDLLGGVRGVENPAETDSLTAQAVRESLEPHSDSSLLGLDYAATTAETFPEDGRVPVAIEGGEN